MRLQIKVFLNDSSFEAKRCLFERILDIDPSISVPFHQMVSLFKFLYGSSCVVTFNVE
jgi:hypothetical protein